jgi:hypothetical protein
MFTGKSTGTVLLLFGNEHAEHKKPGKKAGEPSPCFSEVIRTSNGDKIYKIEDWLGVNESPQGESGLRLGEAAVLSNFKITNNKKLQKRPGTQNIANLLFSCDLAVDDTPTTILTEAVTSTATFQAYPDVTITAGGLLSVTGTPVTVDYGSISGHTGKYYQDGNGVIYLLGDCVYDSGAVGGVQYYRWNKWSCIVSGFLYYLPGSFEAYTDRRLSPGDYVDGWTSYDFNNTSGTYSDAGAPAGIPYGATGTNFMAFGSFVCRQAVMQAGPDEFRLVIARSSRNGPFGSYYYARGSVSCGYVYGQSGAYPDGSFQAEGSTCYWYDGKAENAAYTWRFYRVSITANQRPAPVRGIWSGRIGTGDVICAACDGMLWQLSEAGGIWTKAAVGQLNTDRQVHFFGFDAKLYMQNGTEYKVWDGTALQAVEGYRPLVALARTWDGAQSTAQEPVNMLSGKRRVWFSPDGAHADLTLPEKNLASIDYAILTATGASLAISASNLADGTVTLADAPAAGTDSVEIGYTAGTSLRGQIEAMTLSEYYNGANDNRVFLYGDGSNRAFYSGLDYNGRPTAEYFPDLNVVHIGDANTPLFDLLRHYSELIAFKDGAAYRIRYGQLTLVTGALTAAFYVETINKGIGGSGYGQAQLVENHPRTLDGRSVYEWVAATSGGGITSDQRNARRISQKVEATLRELDLTKAVTFHDKIGHEYYIAENGVAVIQNTENGAWYIYRDFPAVCMIVYRDEVYYGTANGYVRHLSHTYRHDCGADIACYWESGAEAFGKNYMRKYTDDVYIVPQQEDGASVSVSLLTDRASSPAAAQTVASFSTGSQPKTHRQKFKAKSYTWLKLIFSSVSADTAITILSASIKVREIGKVR